MKAKKEGRLDLQEKSWPTQQLFKKQVMRLKLFIYENKPQKVIVRFFLSWDNVNAFLKAVWNLSHHTCCC